jgi:selenocysteine lyase/cysteine desulfurase
MLARQIVIDYREGAGIRIAPHFYNTDDEIRAAVERHRRHLGKRRVAAPHPP